MSEKNMISDFQKKIDDWIQNHGGYWSPLSMLAAIVEELGELAREMNYMEGYKPKKANIKVDGIKEEIKDLFFALICLANYYKVDLEKGLRDTLEKYTKRDANRFI
jgi:NTP pyrophosphatase (non-canonical NTP hydrolase)